MYCIQDKKTKKILHCHPGNISEKLTAEQVYSAFDPKTMKLLKSELAVLPAHYHVDRKGFITELNDEQKIKAGVISFEQLFSDVAMEEQRLAPEFDKVQFVLDEALINSDAKKHIVLNYLSKQVEREIAKTYSPGRELKVQRGYLDWLADGKPKDDSREQDYQTMSQLIVKVKQTYQQQRAQVKAG